MKQGNFGTQIELQWNIANAVRTNIYTRTLYFLEGLIKGHVEHNANAHHDTAIRQGIERGGAD